MQIIWHGQSCFQITANPAKNSHAPLSFAKRNFGGQVRLVIDPYSEETGLRLPKLEADIVLVSHNHYDHNNVKQVSGSPFVISGPGEYEVKGILFQGIHSWHDDKQGQERGPNTIYTIELEEMKLCHLGDLGQKELSSEQLEKIGQVDILMIPVGGVYTIDGKGAFGAMSQIEPKITIPMHYALPKLKIKLDGLDKFLKAVGVKSLSPEPKLSIKKKDLPQDEAKIVLLKP